MGAMTITTKMAMLAAGLAAGGMSVATAAADTCADRPSPVPGTLAASNHPCQQKARAKKDEAAKAAETDRATTRPGNSSFYIGGSVGTDVRFRGR